MFRLVPEIISFVFKGRPILASTIEDGFGLGFGNSKGCSILNVPPLIPVQLMRQELEKTN